MEKEVQALVPTVAGATTSNESSLVVSVGRDQGIADEVNDYANLRRGEPGFAS